MYRKSTEVMRLLSDILTGKFKAAVCPVLFAMFFFFVLLMREIIFVTL